VRHSDVGLLPGPCGAAFTTETKIRMHKSSLTLAAAVAAVLGGLATPASAQNAFHAPADLVLTFWNPGGVTGSTQTVTVALASTTFFRDAAPGSFTLLNTANIGGLGGVLEAQFGATWYDTVTLHMGAIGFRGTSSTATTLLDSDPQQTLYFSKERSEVGILGTASSPTPTTILNSGTGIVGGMGQVKGRIESPGTTAIFVEATSSSFIDENNPTTAGGNQSTAYTNISGGVQGNFGAGSFGTFGAAGQVEMALDLYRLQNRNDVAGQYGFGDPTNVGDYLGTLTINQAGQVGFAAAVPEPSSALLLGFAAVGLFGTRRYRKA
jgi:hypothetical protein